METSETSLSGATRPQVTEEPEEIMEAAKGIVNSLLRALQAIALYPRGHPSYDMPLVHVHRNLEAFLQRYGALRLGVEKNRLLFENEVVHEAPPTDQNPAFILYRDGIVWLEFQEGIDLEETREFFGMLNQYRALSEEPEGDMVTALWEAELPHLQYEATDILWESDPVVEEMFLKNDSIEERLKAVLSQEPETGPRVEGGTTGPMPLELLIPREASLNEMVLLEEERDTRSEVLVMLADILRSQEDEAFLKAILDFMEEGFRDALFQKTFAFALKVLQGTRYIRRVYEKERPQAVYLLNEFFEKVSSPKSLQPLIQVCSESDPNQLETIRKLLLLLPPEAITGLAPMLGQGPSSQFDQMLMDVIKTLAGQDIRPLEPLLDHPNEVVVQKLVQVLRRLDGDRPTQILFGMVQHPFEQIRKEVVKGLMDREQWAPGKLFPLIEDENLLIRLLVLRYLGRHRSEEAEKLLLDYLGQKRTGRSDEEHILACFRALGQCGSMRSIPFLRQVLFFGGWKSRFRNPARRQGAAIALYELGTDEAKQVLEEAGKSRNAAVRQAAQNVTRRAGQPGGKR